VQYERYPQPENSEVCCKSSKEFLLGFLPDILQSSVDSLQPCCNIFSERMSNPKLVAIISVNAGVNEKSCKVCRRHRFASDFIACMSTVIKALCLQKYACLLTTGLTGVRLACKWKRDRLTVEFESKICRGLASGLPQYCSKAFCCVGVVDPQKVMLFLIRVLHSCHQYEFKS